MKRIALNTHYVRTETSAPLTKKARAAWCEAMRCLWYNYEPRETIRKESKRLVTRYQTEALFVRDCEDLMRMSNARTAEKAPLGHLREREHASED